MAASPSAVAQAATADALPLPPNGIRTTVTFLIFVHFFFLFVSIKSKTTASGLEQDLRERAPGLSPYTQLLGMDLSYMFHLTYYDPSLAEPDNFRPADTDFYVDAEIPQPDGTVKVVHWPAADMSPGARYHRFENLVHNAALSAENGNEQAASEMAQGIARRLMAENQCRALTLRFRRRMLQNLMLPSGPELDAELARDLNGPANFPVAYEVNAYLTEENTVGVAAIKDAMNSAAPRLPNAPGATPSGTNPPVPLSTVPNSPIPTGTATGTGVAKP